MEIGGREWVTGMDRVGGGGKVTHLYSGTFEEPGEPLCPRGWNRGSGGYSIFRNNVSARGICKVCRREAERRSSDA